MVFHKFFFCIFWIASLSACAPAPLKNLDTTQTSFSNNMHFDSSSFPSGGTIPTKYACPSYGQNVSPALSWSSLPQGTQSLALTVTDPDAHGFVHWVVYHIPASLDGFTEGTLPEGVDQGSNGFGTNAWGGPCPPSGTHRYVFTLYALDALPGLKPGANLSDLQSAIKGHILGQSELVGKFSKP